MRKRRIIFILFFIIIIIALCWGISYFLNDEAPTETDENDKEEAETYSIDVISRVYYGSIDNTYECDGVVNTNEENYVKVMELDLDNSDKVELKVDIGASVKINDELFIINGKATKSQVEGIVIDIINEADRIAISIIDFDKMYIDVAVTYEIYEELEYDSDIKIENDGQILEGSLINKGYKLEGEFVNAKVAFDGYILPGKKVTVQIQTGQTEEMLFVPSDMVYNINGICFCYVMSEDGAIEERHIEAGNEYIKIENGSKFRYTQIISGLSEGEKIAIVNQ